MKTNLTIRKHLEGEDLALLKPCIIKLDDFIQHPETWGKGGVFPDVLDLWIRVKNLLLDGNENIAGRH